MRSFASLDLFLFGGPFAPAGYERLDVRSLPSSVFFASEPMSVFVVESSKDQPGIWIVPSPDISQDARRALNTALHRTLRENLASWFSRDVRITIRNGRDVRRPSSAGPKVVVFRYGRDGRPVFEAHLTPEYAAYIMFLSRARPDGPGLFKAAKALSIHAYRRLQSLDLEPETLFKRLEDRDIQRILLLLFQTKKAEETTLAGFVQAHPDVRARVLTNLSRNLRDSVSAMPPLKPLWCGQASYLVRSGIVELWREGLLEPGFLSQLAVLTSTLGGNIGDQVSRESDIRSMLLSLAGTVILDRILRNLPSIVIAKALAGQGSDVLEAVRKGLKLPKKIALFDGDLEFAGVTALDERKPQRTVLGEALLDGLLEKEARERDPEYFSELGSLDDGDLRFIAGRTGLVRFSKTLAAAVPEVREAVMARLGPVERSILKDLQSGKIRYRAVFGPTEIASIRTSVMKSILLYRRIVSS